MDKSLTRRRQPCWYLKEGVGMRAINDAAFIRETVVHVLLQDHFGDTPAYPEILKSINEVSQLQKSQLHQLHPFNFNRRLVLSALSDK